MREEELENCLGEFQALHMQSIFAGAKLPGWTEGRKTRIDHVGFGVVLGEDKYEICLQK